MPTHPLWNPFEIPSDEEIAAARVVADSTSPHPLEVLPPDPTWPAQYAVVRDRVVAALGERVLAIEHVGSTAVPGLWAKPFIDVDLTVADSADEDAWLPALEAAGFVLRVREPEWEEHRCLRGQDPTTNLHVFSPGAREPRRHRLFRDWLRSHPDDRDAYAEVKRSVAAQGFTDGMLYNNEKAWFVYDLYEKVLAADPAHPHDPQPRLVVDRSPLPDGIDARLRDQLTFIAEADRLKTILRASELVADRRRENDAEHSWHLALMVILLAEYADEPIDVGHTVQLVVVHDLVEIYAGDSPVFDPAAVADQAEREQAAADRLFTLLPADQASYLRELWDEFEAGATPEARFGKGMDRLQPMLLNWLNRGGTWQMPGVTESTVRAREAGVVAASTRLGDLTGRLVDEGLRRGWIRPD